MGTGECKIPGGVGEARWDVCVMHDVKVYKRCEGERESKKKMIGGERKRKRCDPPS